MENNEKDDVVQELRPIESRRTFRNGGNSSRLQSGRLGALNPDQNLAEGTSKRRMDSSMRGPELSVRASQKSMGQIARAQSNRFESALSKSQSFLRRKTQQYDAAQDVPLWFEKMCELEGATESEIVMLSAETKQNETQMIRMWSEEARGLVDIKVEENNLRDVSELEDLQQRNEELERESVVGWIGVEALASIINPGERRSLAAHAKTLRSQSEYEMMQMLESQRREMVLSYYQRSRMREAELTSSLREGHAMLTRFGELLENACNNMISNNQGKLLEELHRHGIEVGRLRATDAASKLHRKILLNPLDRHQSIDLQNGEMTMVRLPCKEPRVWGFAHATDGPWRVKRYDKGMVREIAKGAMQHINAEHATSLDALRHIAKVLDAVQEGSQIDASLYQQVIGDPRRGRELIQNRLDALGINISVRGVTRLPKIRGDIDIKAAAAQILTKADERLQYYGRFYFEVHAHKLSASNLPSYEPPAKLLAGNGEHGPTPEEFFSLTVEQPRMRVGVPTKFDRMSSTTSENDGGVYNLADSSIDFQKASRESTATESDSFYNLLGNENEGTGTETDPLLRQNSEGEEEENYYESDSDQWMIGVSFNTMQCNGFPGNDPSSFGIRSDGTIWHAGRCRRFCANLSDEVVVGLLLDLNVGSITPFVGGASLGVAFGVGSRVFGSEEQASQGALIRDKHLIPAFALKAKSRPDLETMSAFSDDFDLGGGDIEGDDGSIDGIDGTVGELEDFGLDNTKANEITDNTELLKTLLQAPRRRDGDGVKHDSDSDDADESSPRNMSLTDVEGPEATTQALSINFGGYGFARLPPHALSCDSYLSFATESKQEIDRAKFEAEWNKQRMMASSRKNLSFGDSVDADDENAVGVVMEYKARMAFLETVQYDTGVSWSEFPPEEHRVGYCANVLQRAVRRFLGRRWRQREMLSQTLAITLLQRQIKGVLPAWRRRKDKAAVQIQKVWRGYRLRKQFKMAREFAQHPQLLASAATRIQATVRQRQAEQRMRYMAEAADREIEFLLHSANKIQSKWRQVRASREEKRYRAIAQSVTLVQRLWRGRVARQALDSKIRDRLREHGFKTRAIQKRIHAAVSVQRVWRGKMDRSYARMRRVAFHSSAAAIQFAWRSYLVKCKLDAICDWSTANAAKLFLRGMGAIL